MTDPTHDYSRPPVPPLIPLGRFQADADDLVRGFTAHYLAAREDCRDARREEAYPLDRAPAEWLDDLLDYLGELDL